MTATLQRPPLTDKAKEILKQLLTLSVEDMSGVAEKMCLAMEKHEENLAKQNFGSDLLSSSDG